MAKQSVNQAHRARAQEEANSRDWREWRKGRDNLPTAAEKQAMEKKAKEKSTFALMKENRALKAEGKKIRMPDEYLSSLSTTPEPGKATEPEPVKSNKRRFEDDDADDLDAHVAKKPHVHLDEPRPLPAKARVTYQSKVTKSSSVLKPKPQQQVRSSAPPTDEELLAKYPVGGAAPPRVYLSRYKEAVAKQDAGRKAESLDKKFSVDKKVSVDKVPVDKKASPATAGVAAVKIVEERKRADDHENAGICKKQKTSDIAPAKVEKRKRGNDDDDIRSAGSCKKQKSSNIAPAKDAGYKKALVALSQGHTKQSAAPENKKAADPSGDGKASGPRALRNFDLCCFINSTIHALGSVSEFGQALRQAGGRPIDNGEFKMNADEIVRASKYKLRGNVAYLKQLRSALTKAKESGRLTFSTELSKIMADMASDHESTLDPFLFAQICGTYFGDVLGRTMDGSKYEDASEFLQLVLRQIKDEEPLLGVNDLFDMELEQKMACRSCQTIRTLSDSDLMLYIPESKRSKKDKVHFKDLLANSLGDRSRFENGLKCEKCGKSDWDSIEGLEQKRLSKPSPYVIAQVSRGHFTGLGASKITTSVKPSIRENMILPASNGSQHLYETVAIVNHIGPLENRGHYYAVRKIGQQWYKCDDANRKGVQPIAIDSVEDHPDTQNGTVFLLKRVLATTVS